MSKLGAVSAAPAASRRARRTALANPRPSGPVVVSMPGVMKFSMARRSSRAGGTASIRPAAGRNRTQQRVLQHRAVAVRQHEVVAVEPPRVAGCGGGNRSTALAMSAMPIGMPGCRSWRPAPRRWRGNGWRWRGRGAGRRRALEGEVGGVARFAGGRPPLSHPRPALSRASPQAAVLRFARLALDTSAAMPRSPVTLMVVQRCRRVDASTSRCLPAAPTIAQISHHRQRARRHARGTDAAEDADQHHHNRWP